MQFTQKQLDTQLQKTLSPLYLISGDTSLLIQETRESIMFAARSRNFFEKEICHVDSGFQIPALETHLKNFSLFDANKIIDIRNPAAKFDAQWISLLSEYLDNPPVDRLIIMTTSKLTSAQQKTPWFELIKQKAIYIPIWPIAMESLPRWIVERAKQMQLTLAQDAAALLATYSEGNLLAATQALEKLQLLYPNANISREQLRAVLNDHARFSIFDLSGALSHRNIKKVVRILKNLEQTGEEPPLVLWAICRNIRDGITAQKNTVALKSALQFAATVDQFIKGATVGDAWQGLLQLCMMTMGITI